MNAPRRNLRLGPPPQWRARAVLGGFILFAVVLGGRAFELQVLERAFLTNEGAKRHLRSIEVPAVRGAIRDRRGEPLALSAPTESVWAVPAALLAAPDKIAPLAELLDLTAAELRARLTHYRDRQFVYLQRQLSPEHAREVMAVDAPGVFLQREYRRYYPAGEAAAQLVGLTDIDGKGLAGIELALNERLQGADGSRQVIKDRLGRVVEDLAQFVLPNAGQDVTLTIDLRLQYLAYREVKAAVLEHHARGGVAVMLAPDTGEILALVSYPSFNPNNRASITPEALRHRAVTDTFEPGSTVKGLLIAQALATGAFSLDSVIDTEGGTMPVGNLLVRDFRDYGDVGLQKLLTKSSNVGAAKVGLTMGARKLWQGYHAFGFGQRTGVRFPGERFGVLRGFQEWGKVETATAAYGYGVSVTALQLARAYGAIADDGQLHDLDLLRGPAAGPDLPPRQVVPPSVAAVVRNLLRGVITLEGTGTRAAVQGYDMAGKTGTVQKVGDSGYTEARHQALFVGMAPADDPVVVTLVMIDEPRGDAYYGGLVAAPVFAGIMREALRILGVPPNYPPTYTASREDAP